MLEVYNELSRINDFEITIDTEELRVITDEDGELNIYTFNIKDGGEVLELKSVMENGNTFDNPSVSEDVRILLEESQIFDVKVED